MEKEIRHSIHIHATPEQVWDTLTNPDKIEQYMYGSRPLTDWHAGSPIDYYMDKEGEDVGVVKGMIIKADKSKYLAYTLFPIGWEGLEDVPENYLTNTYQITPAGDGADLTIAMSDFTKVGFGEQRYKHTASSFEEWIAKIKEVAEK